MAAGNTLVHQLAGWAQRRPDAKALFAKRNGAWVSITWAEYWRDVRRVAKGLIALGHAPERAVALVGKNRPEWVIAEFGIMAAGGMPAPIYTTNTKEQTAYVVKQSESEIVIADDREQLSKLLAGRQEGLFAARTIVTMDDLGDQGPDVITLEALKALGDRADDAELDRRLGALRPDQTGLLIYTSGTTGLPKGAELSHRGLGMMGPAIAERMPHIRQPQVVLSYLPLCHAAEQIFTNFITLVGGGEVHFCPELKELKEHIGQVRPTLFLGVPRVWEKFEAALRAKLSTVTGMKAKIARWAMRVELEAFKRSIQENRRVDSFARRTANKLFTSKIKAALGFDRLVNSNSGAAPIATSTLEFFASVGIAIEEGFGMTETTGVATTQDFGLPKFGTVGRALPGVEIRIAEDHEILLKGDNMTKGYYKKPEETAGLFTEDGWLKTGDLGALENGLLKITGRKKDLLKTAGGKYVAPIEVEQYLAGIPGVAQTVVIGDRRPYLTLLVALDPDTHGLLAQAAGVPAAPIAELAKNPKVKDFLRRWIEERCNAKLARYQTIKSFEIVPEPFSVAGGEVTPTMKVKRSVVEQKYAGLIEQMYAAGEGRGEAAA